MEQFLDQVLLVTFIQVWILLSKLLVKSELCKMKTFAGSDDQWRASGGLWAVGKYQFIPSTLQMLMDKNNISPNTLFTPELQDYLALQLLTIQGPQAWIGVMENGRVKISQAKFNILQQAAQMKMPNFGPAKWRQPDTLDPAVVEAYQNGL